MSADTWHKLREPFPTKDIEWRVQRSGVKNGKGWAMVLAYVTNRAIQQRLDDVVGPENWKNEYSKAPDDGVLCGISVRVMTDGVPYPAAEGGVAYEGHTFEWVTKYDGAENTAVEAVKGGLSGAMKRAAVQWGIGRYLYNLESTFVQLGESGENWITIKHDGKELKGYWNPPALPEWALPTPEADPPPEDSNEPTEPADPPTMPVATISQHDAADLLALAKGKGYDTKEAATEFLNAITLSDFTTLRKSELTDIRKAILLHHKDQS